MSRSQQKSSNGVADIAEERFTMQETARGFSFIEEALLVFEAQDLSIERYTNVVATIPNATQSTVLSVMRKKKKRKSYYPDITGLFFQEGR